MPFRLGIPSTKASIPTVTSVDTETEGPYLQLAGSGLLKPPFSHYTTALSVITDSPALEKVGCRRIFELGL